MKLGLICPEVPGHLNPLTTLGAELRSREHEVVVLGGAMAQAAAERAGLESVILGEGDPLLRRIEEGFLRLGELQGSPSKCLMARILGWQAAFLMRHLPPTQCAHEFDGWIVDQLSPAGCVVAERMGVPFVVVCNALSIHWDPLVPPSPMLWDYRADWVGRVRNWGTKIVVSYVYSALAKKRETGVDPLMLVLEPDHGLAHLAQQPEFFDFPREAVPAHFHYTGPWHRPERDDGFTSFPWERLKDDVPLLYASMGTLQNRRAVVFEAILEAVVDLPMQVVLSKGGSTVDFVAPIPENVIVVDRSPQLRLLERASLVITHAGLNTVLECLAHGVPMLCLPVTHDQPGVAKRVEWLGAGRVLPVERATASRIREELDGLVEDPAPRRVAEQARDRIAAFDGSRAAADIIERALETRKLISREIA